MREDTYSIDSFQYNKLASGTPIDTTVSAPKALFQKLVELYTAEGGNHICTKHLGRSVFGLEFDQFELLIRGKMVAQGAFLPSTFLPYASEVVRYRDGFTATVNPFGFSILKGAGAGGSDAPKPLVIPWRIEAIIDAELKNSYGEFAQPYDFVRPVDYDPRHFTGFGTYAERLMMSHYDLQQRTKSVVFGHRLSTQTSGFVFPPEAFLIEPGFSDLPGPCPPGVLELHAIRDAIPDLDFDTKSNFVKPYSLYLTEEQDRKKVFRQAAPGSAQSSWKMKKNKQCMVRQLLPWSAEELSHRVSSCDLLCLASPACWGYELVHRTIFLPGRYLSDDWYYGVDCLSIAIPRFTTHTHIQRRHE